MWCGTLCHRLRSRCSAEVAGDRRHCDAFVEQASESPSRQNVVDDGGKLNVSANVERSEASTTHLICDLSGHITLSPLKCPESLAEVELDVVTLAFHTHSQ